MMASSNDIYSALLALCEENPPVTGRFPSEMPVPRPFDVFFDLRPNKRLNNQSKHRWFDTPSRSSIRHCNYKTQPCLAMYSAFIGHLYITMTSWWARWRLKSSASRLFTQPFIQAQIKENINSPRNWLLWGEFTSERWISSTKGQYRGKCFHLMMSSWFCRFEHHLFTGIVNIHPLWVLQLRCLFMFWLSWGAINIS